MRYVLRAIAVAAVLLALSGGWIGWQLTHRPDPDLYTGQPLPPAPAVPGVLRVRFLGVSTLLFEDGETAILTDGFFSRPGPWPRLLAKVAPDRERIARELRKSGIERLAAVIVLHSHYDHAMDAPEVALRTGALLVGSESTANVGRGWGLAEQRIRVVQDGERLRFGRFTVTLLRSAHSPVSARLGGAIDRPLRPPAWISDYREGDSYALLVEREGRAALVQASAGYVEGALNGRRADVVFLGVGALGKEDDAYRQAYWDEVVRAVGARRVLPIHWDDFTRPLDEPLLPLPYLLDDLARTMTFLAARAAADGVELRALPLREPVDPFAGL